MTGKTRLNAALKALKVKQSDLLSWREYEDRVVVVTRCGRKLTWRSNPNYSGLIKSKSVSS